MALKVFVYHSFSHIFLTIIMSTHIANFKFFRWTLGELGGKMCPKMRKILTTLPYHGFVIV